MMKKQFATMTQCFALILLTCTPVVYAAKETATVRETTTVTYLDNGFIWSRHFGHMYLRQPPPEL